ncbi:MAG: 60S ribosomal protein L31 [Candidatus Heimdallarchaeota archaeon]|nr:60S ribosomal protein L31 [Candidatus Heimdallarchaeota archaeon]MDH5645015.1 60S ribosomal protein L31 [Candidatus Heimdallarchaeota archaeon]
MSHQIVLERTYTVPFYPRLNSIPRGKRAQKAMAILKEFIARHMKAEDILIDPAVNAFIFSRGMKKPPRRVSVRAVKSDDDVIEVYLIGTAPEDFFKSDKIPTRVEPSEEDIDSEEDFDEDEE